MNKISLSIIIIEFIIRMKRDLIVKLLYEHLNMPTVSQFASRCIYPSGNETMIKHLNHEPRKKFRKKNLYPSLIKIHINFDYKCIHSDGRKKIKILTKGFL